MWQPTHLSQRTKTPPTSRRSPGQNQALQGEVAGVVPLQSGQGVQGVVNGVLADEVLLVEVIALLSAELVVHHSRVCGCGWQWAVGK